jgi:cytochrome c biogenesis protein CcdA
MFMMRLKIPILILFLLFPATALSQTQTDKPVEILLFTSTHCHPCQEVENEVIPRLKEKYGGKINIQELDFDKPENYVRLLELQDKYDWHPTRDLTPTLFINGKFLVGSDNINKYSNIYIDSELSKRGYIPVSGAKPSVDLISRFKLIRPLGVIVAGLIDGINPCAFTAIIFFISFLALQGYGKRQVLAIGLSFILAVFVIYVLIGLGLFSFLYQLKSYWVIVKIVYVAGALLCFILAGLAFYDFLRFRRTRQTQDLILKLPPGLKQRIQGIIGLYYRKSKDKDSQDKNHILRLIAYAFVVGCLVSFFEAVCTGQVYLPTIVFVLKTTPLKLKAFFYLLIYNLMFILPLWLILLFALWGVTSEQFSKLAQKHMGTIKILMMALFLGLGLFLIWQ